MIKKILISILVVFVCFVSFVWYIFIYEDPTTRTATNKNGYEILYRDDTPFRVEVYDLREFQKNMFMKQFDIALRKQVQGKFVHKRISDKEIQILHYIDNILNDTIFLKFSEYNSIRFSSTKINLLVLFDSIKLTPLKEDEYNLPKINAL